MAYRDIKDIAKQVRKDLKVAFPKCKFSVRIKRFSGGQALDVYLMKAPESPFASLQAVSRGYGDKFEYYDHDGTYAQLNQFHIEQNSWLDDEWYSNGYHLTEKAAKMFEEAIEIANRENWNNSRIEIDYFDVNYYFHIGVGQWDKPFEVTK